MARLAAITVAELDGALAQLAGRLAAAGGVGGQRAELRAAHELLIRALPSSPRPPLGALTTVATALAAIPVPDADRAVDGLSPRPRTVFRLLRAGAFAAAWAVVSDNATGAVTTDFGVATSSGAARTEWRLPLLTLIEPPVVFAWLPGFRDPRFDVPDGCYDITGLIRPRLHLDDAWLDRAALVLVGSLALDHLDSAPTDTVQLVVRQGRQKVVVPATRHRRADLVRGTVTALTRPAWAGWSARIDLRDRRLIDGQWSLSVAIEHNGIRRSAVLGPVVGQLAAQLQPDLLHRRRRAVRLAPDPSGWRLLVGG